MENHVVFPFSEFSRTVAHCHFLLGSGTAASPNLEQDSTATFLFWHPLSTTLLLHISATHGYAFLRFLTTLFLLHSAVLCAHFYYTIQLHIGTLCSTFIHIFTTILLCTNQLYIAIHLPQTNSPLIYPLQI